MIFQSLEFTTNPPSGIVVIHGLIRDAEGRKMSKSLGNGVDPIDVIERYGADSLRYFIFHEFRPRVLICDTNPKKSNRVWNFHQ